MSKYFRYGIAILLSSLLSITAYAEDVLRVGYQKSATALVLLKGEKRLENRLQPTGMAVKWVEFPGGPQLLEGLNVGAIDIGYTGETPPIFAQAAGADLVYIANDPASPSAEAILVMPDSAIRSVADLKGKRIALNKGSNVHYLLVRALEEAGLRYQDITPVYLAPADARAAFERGSVDAWVVWDPFAAAAENQIHARVLRDGKGLAANYLFYLASRNFVSTHPQAVTAFIEEIQHIDQEVKQDPERVARQIAPLLGVSEEIARIVVGRQSYDIKRVSSAVIEGQQQVADTFASLKLIPKLLDVKQAVWTPAQ